jgi:putative transposase
VTAGQCDSHLTRCLGYIDLDLVPAGVVQHPEDCSPGGYRQFQTPPDTTG